MCRQKQQQTPRLTQAALTERDPLTATHFVDAAYINAGLLTSSKSEHHIDLVGPLRGDVCWQAKEARGYDLTAIHID
jgi:transposase